MNTVLTVTAAFALFSMAFCLPIGNIGGGIGDIGGLGGLGNLPILGPLLNGSSAPGDVLGLLGGLPLDPSLLQNLTEPAQQAVSQLLNSTLPISKIESQLQQLAAQLGFSDQLSQLISQLTQLQDTLTQVVSNLPTVLSSLQYILDDKNQTLPEQNQAIEQLLNQNPLEVTSLLSILQQLLQLILGGGVLPTLPTAIPTDLPVTLPTVNTAIPV